MTTNVLRRLKKQRIMLWNEVNMINGRVQRSLQLDQRKLTVQLIGMLDIKMSYLRANAVEIDQARIVLGKPWRGKGC